LDGIFFLSLSLLLAPVPIFGLILVFLLPVFVRLFRHCHMGEVTPEWLENFSAGSYRPMEDLLGTEDFHFLVRQPGFDRALYRRLRRDRLRIFRQYLNRLISDFNRLHTYARYLLAQTEEDHSELLIGLIRLRVKFSLTVLRVELRYLACCLGYHPLVTGVLVGRLEEMSEQLKSIAGGRSFDSSFAS
jgi:hypothetical protein